MNADHAADRSTTVDPIDPIALRPFVERYFTAWNSHVPAAVAACATDDVVWHSPAVPAPGRGRPAVEALVATTATAFPDYEFTRPVPWALADDDLTAYVPWRMTGTNTGTFVPPGYAPTGRPIDLDGIDVWQLRGGLIHRYRAVYDYSDVARQLGLALPRGGAAERLAVHVQRAWVRLRALAEGADHGVSSRGMVG